MKETCAEILTREVTLTTLALETGANAQEIFTCTPLEKFWFAYFSWQTFDSW